PADGCEQTVCGALERPGNVVDFEKHAPFAKDQFTGADCRASPTKNYVMSMARLLVLAENMHLSEDILHEHVVCRCHVGRESPALAVPAVIAIAVPHGGVGGQRHKDSFKS
ncbi:MAG TPA: hypothetical protein VFB30_13420, partial [Spirochaetia bacterium]|nr:hypothetical protein [Spirochaetia bacterium]